MKTALPKRGRPSADVLAELTDFAKDDPNYKQGRLWSLRRQRVQGSLSLLNSDLPVHAQKARTYDLAIVGEG